MAKTDPKQFDKTSSSSATHPDISLKSYPASLQTPSSLQNQSVEEQRLSNLSGVFNVLGVLVILSGVVLVYGNVSGSFPTFDYAGSLLMAIGAGLTRLAGNE